MSDNDTISRSKLLERLSILETKAEVAISEKCVSNTPVFMKWAAIEMELEMVRRIIETAPAVSQEMSAREYLYTTRRMCIYYEACTLCPAFGIACGKLDVEDSAIEQAAAVAEKWAREHPEETN